MVVTDIILDKVKLITMNLYSTHRGGGGGAKSQHEPLKVRKRFFYMKRCLKLEEKIEH